VYSGRKLPMFRRDMGNFISDDAASKAVALQSSHSAIRILNVFAKWVIYRAFHNVLHDYKHL
jgi:hypothetical protein